MHFLYLLLMKPLITLQPLQHRSGEKIGIYFKNDLQLNILVRSKGGATWSQSARCWHIPMTQAAYDHLKAALDDKVILQTAALKKYLDNNKKATRSIEVINKPVFQKAGLFKPIKPHCILFPQ